MCDAFRMLQVWKIEIQSGRTDGYAIQGWALADTAEEAKSLSGHKDAVIERKPEHLWIAPERIVWENQTID